MITTLLASVIRHIRENNGDKMTENLIIRHRFIQSVASSRLEGLSDEYLPPFQYRKAAMTNSYSPEGAKDLRDYLWAISVEAGLAANYLARLDEEMFHKPNKYGGKITNGDAVKVLRTFERQAVRAWRTVCERNNLGRMTTVEAEQKYNL